MRNLETERLPVSRRAAATIKRINDEAAANELQRKMTRRWFVGGLSLASAAVGLGILIPGGRKILEPVPTFPPAPTAEPTPIPQAVDISLKDAEFRLLSEVPLGELGQFNRKLIYDTGTKFSEFDLPEEVLIRKDWRDDDRGYTKVTPRKVELSAESGELAIVEPSRIMLSSDLFRGNVRLEKKEIELHHAAAELPFVNFIADPLGKRYADARDHGALSVLQKLAITHDSYTDWLDQMSQNPSWQSDYQDGFYIFNEYMYMDESERDEADLLRQNGRMESSLADHSASIVNTAMTRGIIMAQRIADLPIKPNEISPPTTEQTYSDSPQKTLAKNSYDRTMDLLRLLVKPGVSKPEKAANRLIHDINDIYLATHVDIQEDSQPEVSF